MHIELTRKKWSLYYESIFIRVQKEMLIK